MEALLIKNTLQCSLKYLEPSPNEVITDLVTKRTLKGLMVLHKSSIFYVQPMYKSFHQSSQKLSRILHKTPLFLIHLWSSFMEFIHGDV